jgi:hypothetical protein
MKFVKRGATVAFAAVAAFAGVVFSGGVASAATSPIAACGSSYHVQESHDIKGLATVYLMYNGSTNCVVTWHSAALQGVARYTYASVQKQGGSVVEDGKTYTSYAGPVKVTAPGVCISFSGMISDGSGKVYGYESPWVHCG